MYFKAVSQMDRQTGMRRTVSSWPIFFIHWCGNEHANQSEWWILNCVNTGEERFQKAGLGGVIPELQHHLEEVTSPSAGNVCVCVCVCSAANLRLALFNPMDRSLPGSSCPWDFPGGNTGVSCHFLLQGIFPTLGSNLSLLHRQAGSLPPSHLGSPYQLAMVTMTRYGVLTPIGPFMRYETCVSDNFVHCTEHSVPPGFICERICIRQGPN